MGKVLHTAMRVVGAVIWVSLAVTVTLAFHFVGFHL